MSSQINLIAILTPKEGKADRLVELLQEISTYVEKNEPGTLKYQINIEADNKSGSKDVFMVEHYKDKAAFAAHGSSDIFKAFQKKVKDEDILGSPMQLKFVKEAGGFASRL